RLFAARPTPQAPRTLPVPLRAQLRVGQHDVRVGDLAEVRDGRGVRVHVGVEGAGELAVDGPDRLFSRVGVEPQHLVWVAHHFLNLGIRTPWRSAGANRSPTSFSRSGTVRRLNCLGSKPGSTSLHFNGVETRAPSTPRSEYGAMTVLPCAFCMQSKYNRPLRFSLERSSVTCGSFCTTVLPTDSANACASS